MKAQAKALELVLVLFVLIVTIYVLLNLFKDIFAKESSKLVEIQGQEESKMKANEILNYCNNLCKKYQETNDERYLYEFCSSFNKFDLDLNHNYNLAEKSLIPDISLGVYNTCEDAIPCFIITNCNVGGKVIRAKECKDIMCNSLKSLNISEAAINKKLNIIMDPGKCYESVQTFHWFNLAFPNKKPGQLACE